MQAVQGSFFTQVDEDTFASTEHTRGPWAPGFQHAGPASALMGRALERLAGPDWLLRRFTIDLLCPIPIAPLRVAASSTGGGRSVRRYEVELFVADRCIARTRAVGLARHPVVLDPPETPAPDVRDPDELESTVFDFFAPGAGYHEAMDVRVAFGAFQSGPAVMWLSMRIPLVDAEVPTPLQRVLCAADSGNGLSIALPLREWTFVNADLNVAFAREPVDQWIGMDATTIVGTDGVAVASTRIFDRRGWIGDGLQTLVVRPR